MPVGVNCGGVCGRIGLGLGPRVVKTSNMCLQYFILVSYINRCATSGKNSVQVKEIHAYANIMCKLGNI